MSTARGEPGPGETQPERTALAWQRTGFGVLAVGGLLAHAALTSHRVSLVVLAGLVAVLALLVLGVVAPLRYREVRATVASGTPAGDSRAAVAVAGAVLLTACAATVAVILLLR